MNTEWWVVLAAGAIGAGLGPLIQGIFQRSRRGARVTQQGQVTESALTLLSEVEAHWKTRAAQAEADCTVLRSEIARLRDIIKELRSG